MALTTRNVFILNLALSDLMLCCFTMPLTLLDLVTLYWQLEPDKVRITLTLSLSYNLYFVVSFHCNFCILGHM